MPDTNQSQQNVDNALDPTTTDSTQNPDTTQTPTTGDGQGTNTPTPDSGEGTDNTPQQGQDSSNQETSGTETQNPDTTQTPTTGDGQGTNTPTPDSGEGTDNTPQNPQPADPTPTQPSEQAKAKNRFAISFLSKKNRSKAVNEEVLMDKETGEMLLKTPNGYVISFDSISRFHQHKDRVIDFCKSSGLSGSLYDVRMEHVELPLVLTLGQNLFGANQTTAERIDIFENNPRKFLVSFDIDTIELSENLSSVGVEPEIELLLTIGPEDVTIRESLSDINSKIFNPASNFPVGTDVSTYAVTLREIKVFKNEKYTDDIPVRHILHSMIIVK